jgi:nitrite reductase/ring-hydroxylating ferredoxin subunit
MSAAGAGIVRVALTADETREVSAGRFVRVELGIALRLPDGLRALSAFVGRAGGKVVAFANRCQHNPVPLDTADIVRFPSGVRAAPMADDGVHLLCQSHGALYRPADGLCTLGPCYGQRLFPLEVTVTAGEIALVIRD